MRSLRLGIIKGYAIPGGGAQVLEKFKNWWGGEGGYEQKFEFVVINKDTP